ncbi:Afadin- and alpha-actinin-binding protein [Armadillidium vulgare]|nr:Afadin- and alpha-actinin-binding protein [Armadillidium vulgare]
MIFFSFKELQSLGFGHKIIEPNEERLNLVALINAFWDVLQLYHSAVKDGNTLHDSRRRDIADLNHLQGSVRDLKLSLEEKDRLMLEAQEKERQANSINKALATKLKSEKEEVKRLSSALQQRELQYQHESKKKELEMNKLRDKLHRFLTNDRGTECRISSLMISSPLDRSDRARGRWRTDNTNIKHEEELFRRVLGQYEAWVGQLSEEVDLLKEVLSSVSGKLSKIAVKCANLQINSVAQEDDCLNESLACSVLSKDTNVDEDPLFSLNFITHKAKIQKNIEDNLEIILKQLDNKDKSQPKKSKETVENDETDSRSEQFCEELRLRLSLDSNLEKNINDIVEGMCAEKISEMEEAMRHVLDMKKNLEGERKVFTAAAVRLNKERASFEAEKVELLKHQFLEEFPSFLSSSGNPFTPNTSLDSPEKGRSITDLYGDPPHSTSAVPIFTSPSGDITRTSHPIVLGPTRMARPHSKQVTRNGGGISDPCTRNSSMSRYVETQFLHEAPRSRTVERPESSFGARSALERTSIDSNCPGGYSTHSLSRISKRRQLDQRRRRLSASSSALLSHSINCPPFGEPIEKEDKNGRETIESFHRFKPSSVSSHAPLMPVSSLSTEDSNYDSGFSNNFDPDDLDSNICHISASSYTLQQKFRDAQTNNRLDAIENSILNLLEQINDRERMANPTSSPDRLIFPSEEHVKRDEAEIITEQSSGRVFIVKKNKLEVLPNKPRSQSFRSYNSCGNFGEPQFRHSFTSTKNMVVSSQTQQVSAPTSASGSRNASGDRKTGENYLKKLQSNLSKWYRKS